MRALIIIWASLISFCVCASEDAEFYDETDVFGDLEFISSASRMLQAKHRSPSSVTVIDSAMIDALAPRTFVEVLRLVPGFVSFYINGSLYGVSGHDFTDDDPRRLEVRVNGRSVYVPSYPTISWESLGITPHDIERIEVVRGSNVPAYGSNAIIGAIDITTTSPVRESGGAIRASAGYADTRNVNFQSNFTIPAGGYGQLRVAHRENDGFDGLDDNASMDHLVISAAFTPSLQSSFELEFGLSDGMIGTGDGDHPDEFTDTDTRSYWVVTDYSWFNDEQKFAWTGSFYDRDLEQEGERDSGLYGDRKNQLWQTEFEYQHQFSEQLRSMTGLGYKSQDIKSRNNLDSQKSITNHIYYAFGHIEWQFSDGWLLNLGLMMEDQKTDELRASPRASIHYEFNPLHTLRLSSSRVYRSPTVWEYHHEVINGIYDIGIDYNLKSDKSMSAEQMDSLELAYFGEFFEGKLKADLRIFREEMEDAIDHASWRELEPPVTPNSFPIDRKVNVFGNNKWWDIWGFDTQIVWQLSDRTDVYLQYAHVEYDAERITRVYPPPRGPSVRPQFGVPRDVASVFVTHDFGGGWSASLLSYHQSTVDWRGGAEDPVSAFERHDVALSKQFDLNNYSVDLDLKIENLTDEPYLEYQDGNIFERRVYISVGLTW